SRTCCAVWASWSSADSATIDKLFYSKKSDMAIDKQSEANRLSKQKSASPKTADGRAAVRPILKHGLSSLVLSTESEADFQALLDSYEAEHKPSTATEKALVTQLATTTWRLRRLHNI